MHIRIIMTNLMKHKGFRIIVVHANGVLNYSVTSFQYSMFLLDCSNFYISSAYEVVGNFIMHIVFVESFGPISLKYGSSLKTTGHVGRNCYEVCSCYGRALRYCEACIVWYICEPIPRYY